MVFVAWLDEFIERERESHETKLLPLAVDIRSIWFTAYVNIYMSLLIDPFQWAMRPFFRTWHTHPVQRLAHDA